MGTKSNFSYVLISFAMLISQVFTFSLVNAQSKAKLDSVAFEFNPKEQTWVVPAKVSKIYVAAYGAQGGSERGGKGGLVTCELSVKPGAKLFIYVGGQPSDSTGGYNGGGTGCGNGTGGGGATDIRLDSNALENRVVVAGGGGGMGYIGFAGGGGDTVGGVGGYDTLWEHTAFGGTQYEGGKAARAYLSAPGELAIGGNGLDNFGVCSNGAMGGGGGGYYGGGSSGAGGGGGGSSYVISYAENVVHKQGINSGNGKLIIYWDKKK